MKQEQEELLGLLHPLTSREQSRKEFLTKRRKQVFVAFCAALLFCVLMYIKEGAQAMEQEYQLPRPEHGKKEYELVVSDGSSTTEIMLSVTARRVTGEELEKRYEEAFAALQQQMLGKNTSLSEIRYEINLMTELEEYEMTVEWDISDAEYLGADGSVQNKELSEAVTENIGVMLCYGEEYREYELELVVLPYPYSEEEVFIHELTKSIAAYDEQTEQQTYQALPDRLEGEVLGWQLKSKEYWKLAGILGLGIVLLIYYRAGAVLQQKRKEREEQLLTDYPALLGKMILLLGAGLTVRGAWERIAGEYKTDKKERYAYAEMQRALLQMELGMPEERAYEQFGTRCGILAYMRFTTLLTQNLKKGSKRLIPLLQMESQEAFSERKEQARRKGEEAGTKLLLPMGGMLVIVLILILVPAFISFQIG